MNFFQALNCKKVGRKFEQLAQDYWAALPVQQRSDMVRFQYRENDDSASMRMKISAMLPDIEEAAALLGVNFEATSYPAPAVGGPIVPVNIFRSVIDPQIGHSTMDRKLIADTIVRVRRCAEKECQRQIIHYLQPWNWLIDLCAFIIRLPFLILRRAGLPPKTEEALVSQIIKIVGVIVLVSFLAYKGISLTGIDLTGFIQNLLK